MSEQTPFVPDDQQDSSIQQLPDSRWRKVFVRLAALFLTVVFLLFIAINLFPLIGLPTFDLILESRKLTSDPIIKAAQSAILSVSVGQKQGTGFIIDADGLILTNSHVIDQAGQINLQGLPDNSFSVIDWQLYPKSDLAFIDIEAHNLPFLSLAEQSDELTDEPVTVIGNPLGFFRIANQATVIGYTRLSGIDTPVLMLKGSIYKGHSGSPVINRDGQVIGVVFAIEVGNPDDEKIAFAIPASEILRLLAEYESQKTDP
jgi:serine protease Do